VFGDAAWEPIIESPDRHDRVVALLTAPGRSSVRSGARRHLLTYGIGECGVCGSVLRVVKRGGHELYVCDAATGCVGRRREWVDDLVERIVVLRLSQPDAWDLLVRDDAGAAEARDRAEAVRARMAGAADAYADGEIDRDQLGRITAKLRPELERAEQEAARSIKGIDADMVTNLAGPHAAQRWAELSVAQRRTLLGLLRLHVRLLPARGGPGFKPESVEITFEGIA
jgi:hypothetical protein